MPKKEEEGGKKIKLDPEYAKLAQDILSDVKDEQSRQAVAQLLGTPQIRETYEILKKDGLPRRTIHNIMADENTLRNLSRHGGRITVTDYLRGIVRSLEQNEHYSGIIEEMYAEEILPERVYREAKGHLGEHAERHLRHAKSGLEQAARAAVWILLFLGGILMLFSATTITGAVVGASASQPFTFVLGFILFVIGLLLFYRNR